MLVLSLLISCSNILYNSQRVFITQSILLSEVSPDNKKSSTNIRCEILRPCLPILILLHFLLVTSCLIRCESLSMHKTMRYKEIGPPLLDATSRTKKLACGPILINICFLASNCMHDNIYHSYRKICLSKNLLDKIPTKINFDSKIPFLFMHDMHHLFCLMDIPT